MSGARPTRVAAGERLSGFIYGTIVVLAVIIAGTKAYPHKLGHVIVLALVTAVVFWIAHVYAHALGDSVAHDERVSFAELKYIARREASMIEAALPPVGALFLGAVGLIADRTAIWIAVGLGLAVLVAQGIAFARMERLGRLGTIFVIAMNLGLGVVLIALKLLVTH